MGQPARRRNIAKRLELIAKRGYDEGPSDTISGVVTHVTVSKSTGHTILDEAAISALQQWRFAPHSAVEVSVPITFSMDAKSPNPTGKQ